MKTKNRRNVLMIAMVAVILVAGLLFTGCGKDKAGEVPAKNAEISEKLPKMVDFWAPHCPPCREMIPMLKELEEEYAHAFELVKINTSEPENQAVAIQNQIRYIPTQIFYDENGKQLFRHTGYYSKQQILDKWKELGYDMMPKAKD